MNILIVDDSRIMRSILKNIIADANLPPTNVLEASNGVDAFDILKKEAIDLVLLDWNMPQLNGLELVKKLRNSVEFNIVPIIMVTSEAAKYNVIEAVKAGVNDYVIKPVSEKGILEKIKKYTKAG